MKQNLRLIIGILLMSLMGFSLYNYAETDLEKSIILLVFAIVIFISITYLILTFDYKPKSK